MEEVVSYADMLRSGEDEGAYLFSPAPSSISSPSSACYSTAAAQMLCFGAMEEDAPIVPLHGVVVPLQRSSDSSSMSSLSSSPSSIPAANTVATSKTAKKKVGSGSSRIGGKKAANGAATSSAMKKPKTEATNTCHGSTKVRKEKIGDRIIALQQLVSPFGKSDTASVLHEALGYIRFLHDQVQVLSSPYLQRLPSSANLQEGRIRSGDLRGRGLCLVPVSCMEHVASTNGADLWSPAAMGSNEQQISSPADLKH